jgi:L-lactate dehydrogenase (cytochrome)
VGKAKALGARACPVGRAYLWGLAARVQEGITQIPEALLDEADRTLALILQSSSIRIEVEKSSKKENKGWAQW